MAARLLVALVGAAMVLTGCSTAESSQVGDGPSGSGDVEIASSVDGELVVEGEQAMAKRQRLAEAETFSRQWNRSLVVDYALVGSLERVGQHWEDPVDLGVARARLNGRELHQIGKAATITITDGWGRRRVDCHEMDDQFYCTAPEAQPASPEPIIERPDQGVMSIIGDGGPYALVSVTPPTGTGRPPDVASQSKPWSCWELRLVDSSDVEQATGVWGLTSEICFDDRTGVVVHQRTVKQGRTETFRVETLSDSPSEDDLDPIVRLGVGS